MAGYQGYNTTTAFDRALYTTMARRVREVEDCSLRNYRFPALMDARGQIITGVSGEGVDWPVKNKLHTIETNTGETPRTYNRKNLWTKAYLEFRGYQVGDAIYRREYLSNRGAEAIVKVFDNFISNLTTSMEEGLAKQYFVDGEATGNDEKWHGLETMFGLDSSAKSVKYTDGTEQAITEEDYVAWPAATYAGISTELGAGGGSMDRDGGSDVWPDADSSPEYDFWTPIIAFADSSRFGGTNKTWADQCEEVMAYCLLHAQRNSTLADQITQVLMNRTWFREFKEKNRPKERIEVTSENGLKALGFGNVIMFDDAELSWDVCVGANKAYGLSIANCELHSMEDGLLHSEGPFYVQEEQCYKADVSTLSNLKFKSPRNFFKIANEADLD